ncbi:Uncharacterised protein [Mycobacterium tuberculosis]|nr:Uncharacterised protein [Mycobacterium tuberculosis]
MPPDHAAASSAKKTVMPRNMAAHAAYHRTLDAAFGVCGAGHGEQCNGGRRRNQSE